MENKKLLSNSLVFLLILALIVLTLLTNYTGSTDTGDYSDTAKFFAGKYSADIRSSHSFLLGLVHSPFLYLFNSFIIFKITSLMCLLLIVYSVYRINNYHRKSLWLILLSPIVWYMGPWINPIQLSSLLFLWAYYFIKKYNFEERLRYLFVAGILVGLSWAFWDAMIFFVVAFAIAFFYNKKSYHLLYFLIFVFFGLLPKLILDQIIFGFAFMGIIRYFFGHIASIFFNGIYNQMGGFPLLYKIFVILFLPIFTYKIFSRENWNKNKSIVIFIGLSLFLIIFNAQIRYTLLILPIIILEISKIMSKKQIKIQIVFSTLLILLLLIPYSIQISHSTNAEEFQSMIFNLNKIKTFDNSEQIIIQDLKQLERDYPNKIFIVGNLADDYQRLAHLYWGNKVREFVSIEDYVLFTENKYILFEKTFMPQPTINERRQVWISGGIGRNTEDKTDLNAIDYAIGLGEPINLSDFYEVKKYNYLYISSRTTNLETYINYNPENT